MALNLSKDFTFAPNTVISSSEVNTDFDELYNAFSGLEAGTASMSKLPLDSDPTSALYAATKQYVDSYANYRRPGLTYVSATAVDVQVNTDTANKTKIIFPDGNYRSVTEDTSSANKYRRFDITATAEFTSGTEDSGLRSGLSEATNTWYAIYAVKSTINSANFVLAGDTTLPVIANVSTLNSRYGTNGWVYLGAIRNGDNSATTGDILNFSQVGAMTTFLNTATGSVANTHGIRLATTAGATSLTWTSANGTGAAQIPSNCIDLTKIHYGIGSSASQARVRNSAATVNHYLSSNANGSIGTMWGNYFDDVKLEDQAGNSLAMDIFVCGFMDSVLGVGSNPLI